MSDIYDIEIKRLTTAYTAASSSEEADKVLYDDWEAEGPLFKFITPKDYASECGCLTMIRSGSSVAYGPNGRDDELTEKIRADERIPANPRSLIPDDLPVFAEWQRLLRSMWS